MDYIPTVLQAVPGENYDVYAYIDDGSVRRVNIGHLIASCAVFAPLRDYDCFRSALTVMNGTVAWDLEGNRDPTVCLDVDPLNILECPQAEDPLT